MASKQRILIVDDDNNIAELISLYLTKECFEMDDFHSIEFEGNEVDNIINYCEKLRQEYIKTNDKKIWKELIRWLPESFLQKRTMTMNYENLYEMCLPTQRRYHKLTEWSKDFMKFARQLPYADVLLFGDEISK